MSFPIALSITKVHNDDNKRLVFYFMLPHLLVDEKNVLLHTCCAPCSCAIIDLLLAEQVCPTLFFYNPNIHPHQEYLRRKASVVAYAQKRQVLFIDADYDPETWLHRVKGLENEPERGKRCSLCFDIRLERTALYAHEHGFNLFATTNGIGRWKDPGQVNAAGERAAARHSGLVFLARNWREGDSLGKADRISREEGFYRQKYCGCVYSFPVSKK